MNSAERLTALAFLLAVLVGCSSGSVADSGTDSGLVSCFEPLVTMSGFCEASIAEQVATNPCNDFSTTSQSTCGQFQLWRRANKPGTGSFVHNCIYDTNQNGALVGAKTCGTPDATCTDGCIEYGAVLLSSVTNCGPPTDLCSPP